MTRQATLDLLPVPSWFLDPLTGEVVAINQSALDFLGLASKREIQGREQWQAHLVNGKFTKALAAYLKEGESGNHFRHKFVWRRPDGRKVKAFCVCWWTSDGLVQGQSFPVLPPPEKPRNEAAAAVAGGLLLLTAWEALQWILVNF